MEEYIKLSEAIDAIKLDGLYDGYSDHKHDKNAISILECCPTYTFPTATWIGKPIAGCSDVRCSNCKTVFSANKGKWNFCPECGAKMTNAKLEYGKRNRLWQTDAKQACKELIEAVEPLREFYDIDKIKPYAVYVWTKDTYDNWGVHYGTNIFDIMADDIVFYSQQKHIIPEKAMPIIQNIQSKLKKL